MTKMQEYMQKGEDYILKTYNRYPVVFEKVTESAFMTWMEKDTLTLQQVSPYLH